MLPVHGVIGVCVVLACVITVADSNAGYRILLEAENNAISGSVSVKARNGDRVPVGKERADGGQEEAPEGEMYLRVVARTQPTSTQIQPTTTLGAQTTQPSQSAQGTATTRMISAAAVADDVPVEVTAGEVDVSWLLPKNVQPAPHVHSQIRIIDSSHHHPPPPAHTIHRRDAAGTIHPREVAGTMHRREATGIDISHGLSLVDMTKDGVSGTIDVDKRSIVEDFDMAIPNHELGAKQFVEDELHLLKDAESRIGVFVRQRRNVDTTSGTPKLVAADQFVVEETTVFAVRGDGYIVVAEADKLADHSNIEFFVYVGSADGGAISNPVAFVVHVEHEASADGYPTVPTVFAGVLVLIVVLMALIIPLVTRAKRRRQQGKPMFKPGSHMSRADRQQLQTSGTQETLPYNRSEPNWYGEGKNVFYKYEDEVERERKDLTQTLQKYSEGTGYAAPSDATGKRLTFEPQPDRIQLSKKSKDIESAPRSSGSASSQHVTGNRPTSEPLPDQNVYSNETYQKDEVTSPSSSGSVSSDQTAEGYSTEDKLSHRF